MNQKRNPADFIKQSLGREVLVRLNEDAEITGTLVCLDGALNMVLSGAKEYVNGVHNSDYAKLVLRGNNIFYVCQKPLNYAKKENVPQSK